MRRSSCRYGRLHGRRRCSSSTSTATSMADESAYHPPRMWCVPRGHGRKMAFDGAGHQDTTSPGPESRPSSTNDMTFSYSRIFKILRHFSKEFIVRPSSIRACPCAPSQTSGSFQRHVCSILLYVHICLHSQRGLHLDLHETRIR